MELQTALDFQRMFVEAPQIFAIEVPKTNRALEGLKIFAAHGQEAISYVFENGIVGPVYFDYLTFDELNKLLNLGWKISGAGKQWVYNMPA